jgi:hypothetical protein
MHSDAGAYRTRITFRAGRLDYNQPTAIAFPQTLFRLTLPQPVG